MEDWAAALGLRPENWTPYQGDEALTAPLHWRKPRLAWCCPMSDPFHEDIPVEQIDKMLAVAALTPQHHYLFLTKRAARMDDDVVSGCDEDVLGDVLWEYFGWHKKCAAAEAQDVRAGRAEEKRDGLPRRPEPNLPTPRFDAMWAKYDALCPTVWPLPNVTLGVSISNQAEADAKAGHLLALAAAGWRTMLSIEPMLGPVDVRPFLPDVPGERLGAEAQAAVEAMIAADPEGWENSWNVRHSRSQKALRESLWIIIGAESGPRKTVLFGKERPDDMRMCPLPHVRRVVEQCADAGVPCYVKQIHMPVHGDGSIIGYRLSRDMSEWPEDLRVRQVPERR